MIRDRLPDLMGELRLLRGGISKANEAGQPMPSALITWNSMTSRCKFYFAK